MLAAMTSIARSSLCLLWIAAAAACGDDGPSAPDADPGIRADLRIEQPVTAVVVDDELIFTIVVSNQGPDRADDAGVTTTLPPGITVVSANCAAQGDAVCGGTSTAGGVSWTGLDLAVAANNSNTVTLRVVAVPTRIGPASVAASIVVPPNVTDPDPSAESNTAMRDYDARLARIAGPGGRVDWYQDGVLGSIGETRPIAYDRAPPAAPTTTEVFITGEATQPSCVTCTMTFPRHMGFVGNPSWHPGGSYLLVQVENPASAHAAYNAPAWGIDSDLWIVKADASWAARIWDSRNNAEGGTHHGVLHPRFSRDGSLVVFAERWATGAHGAATMWPGTDGQDAWRGWGLRVLRIDQALLGDPKYHDTDAPMVLESVRLAPNEPAVRPRGDAVGNGRYDPVSIEGNVIRYAFTPVPAAGAMNNQYVDATYACTLSSTTVLAGATCSAPVVVAGADRETWDDVAQELPTGAPRVSFASSRLDPQWRAQTSNSQADSLRTELYVKTGDDEAGAVRVTRMNELAAAGRRHVIGYHQWSPDGSRVVFTMARVNTVNGMPLPSETWIQAVP